MNSIREQQKLGKVLRAARERLGLSQVEVAELLGLGKNTVTRAETGTCGPRHSTLMRYLETLPRLTADALMLKRPTTPPVAWPAIWRWYREQFGFDAELMNWEVRTREDGPEVLIRTEGLRPIDGDLKDPFMRSALLQVVFQGTPAVRRSLEAEDEDLLGGERIIEDETGHHVLRFAEDGSSLSYQARLRPERSATPMALDLPVRTLTLRTEAPAGDGAFHPVLRIWPSSIPEGQPDIARFLYPRVSEIEESEGAAAITLRRPLLGLRYRLAYEPGTLETPRPTKLGKVLRAARERAGLTTRVVAKKARVSAGSISHADSGRDPHYPTLKAYTKHLPDLVPQDIFPAVPADVDLDTREAWEYQRHVHGFEARSVEKTTTIAADGGSQLRIETKGLRALHGDIHDLRVIHGVQRAMQLGRTELEEILADREDISTRTIHGPGGSVCHELRIPKSAARSGLDHTRLFKGAGFTLRAGGGVESGVSIPVTFPLARVTLRVCFPPDYQPLRLSCMNTPLAILPEPKLPSVCLKQPFSIQRGSEGLVVRAVLDRPTIGTSLAIFWTLPEE